MSLKEVQYVNTGADSALYRCYFWIYCYFCSTQVLNIIYDNKKLKHHIIITEFQLNLVYL